MWKYIIRRLILIVPTVFLAGSLVFFMLRVLPGDIVSTLTSEGGATAESKEKLREELGLNDPMVVQYGKWLWGTVNGNLGYSHYQDRYVSQVVKDKIEATMTLAIFAMVFSLAIAFPMGIVSAVKRGSWWDQGIRIFTALSLAVPSFWLGILLIIFASKVFNWSKPVVYTSFFSDPGSNMAQLFLPITCHRHNFSRYIEPSSALDDAGSSTRGLCQDCPRKRVARVLSNHAAHNPKCKHPSADNGWIPLRRHSLRSSGH